MSTNGNQWTPGKTESFTCGSGAEVQIQRPGPEFLLLSGKVSRTFTKNLAKNPDQSATDMLDIIAEMSDEEIAEVTLFATKLVCAMCVSPKVTPNPRPGEIGPRDMGMDFWELFFYAMTNFFRMKVPVGNTEVEVSDLETFRPESSIQGDSVDGVHVSPNSEQFIGDQGLVDGAGA